MGSREYGPCVSPVGCKRPAKYKALRLCDGHYGQHLRGEIPRPVREVRPRKNPKRICAGPECQEMESAKGLCARHYQQTRWKKGLTPLRDTVAPETRNGLGEKWCPSHQGWADPKEFSRRSKAVDGLQSHCRSCRSQYYQANSERVRDSARQRKFGMTRKEFDALLLQQNGVCAVCESDDSGHSFWHVDHDHSCCPGEFTCGKCVRGILCGPCNLALGMVEDDIGRLRALALYLENHAP